MVTTDSGKFVYHHHTKGLSACGVGISDLAQKPGFLEKTGFLSHFFVGWALVKRNPTHLFSL